VCVCTFVCVCVVAAFAHDACGVCARVCTFVCVRLCVYVCVCVIHLWSRPALSSVYNSVKARHMHLRYMHLQHMHYRHMHL